MKLILEKKNIVKNENKEKERKMNKPCGGASRRQLSMEEQRKLQW